MLTQNYNILCELGFEVQNGLVVDQDTNQMVKNNNTGKYLIVKIDDTSYVDWRYYEEFNPYLNFKQLKSLVEYQLNKLAITENRYFQILCTDVQEDKICLIAKNEEEEVRSRYFDKDKGYLCYIDFIFALNGEVEDNMDLYLEDREELLK